VSHFKKNRRSRVGVSTLLLTSLCTVLITGCRGSQSPHNSSSVSTTANAISLVPPFTTREPATYQAVRIVTSNDGSSGERTSKTIVARDGEKRREEFVNDDGESVVYLDIPSGQFVLLPSSQMFADLNQESANAARKNAANSSSELSPDLLLNQEHSGSTYEKIGTEPVDGRPTVKYRVTTANPGPTGVKTETMIWIDESLGMPIKSETTSSFGERSSISRVEVKDIKLSVEERLFDLPANYRKVEVAVILDKTRTNKPALKKTIRPTSS